MCDEWKAIYSAAKERSPALAPGHFIFYPNTNTHTHDTRNVPILDTHLPTHDKLPNAHS